MGLYAISPRRPQGPGTNGDRHDDDQASVLPCLAR